MSEQLTDEQVAWYAGTSRTAKWTADMAVHENIVTLAREVQEHRALRPTCPTCRGSQQIMDLRCDNCGGSASLPFGMTCSNHLARPTPCPDCTDGKIPLDKWVALLLAQCVRQRALLDDLRACPSTIAAPRLVATSDDVNSWPFVVTVSRSTWDALHAIGGES